MAIGVFFLAVLFRFANSQLPYIRTCDPVPKITTQTPTVCSNYENIKYISEGHESLKSAVLQLKTSLENNNVMLKRLERTLNNSLAELTRATESQSSAIQSLRSDAHKLEKHQERVGGNFSEIQQRLDKTEKKLIEKKAKLESLETKTEAAFENMNTLLNTYKDELSHLNSTAQNLKTQLEGQLKVTKVDLEEKLDVIERNTAAFSTKLHIQKTELDHKITSRFNKVIHELKTQNTTMNHLIGQTAETETEASFNGTRALLETYKNKLSLLNLTTRGIEDNLENRLDATKADLEKKLQRIEETTEVKIITLALETEASFNSSKTLLDSYKNQISRLNSTTQDLKVNFESRLNVTKMDLENQLQMIQLKSEELTRSTNNHKIDINILKNEVDKLEKHQEGFGGNFSDIEERLDVTERQLMEKKARLENLETETEAAFNDTNKLLNAYKKELSHLKSTAQYLEVKVEAQVNVTKMDIEEKLEAVQKTTEAFSTKLHNQKIELDHKITSRFHKAIDELKTQNATMNHLIGQTAAKLENLETETEAAFNNTNKLLSSYKKELSHLKSTAQDLEVKVENGLNITKLDLKHKLEAVQKNNEVFNTKLSHEKSVLGSNIESLNKELKMQNLTVNHLLDQIAVQKNVAFSATIIESANSFTGPNSPGTSNVLKFDRVFTNVGNAYDKKTGIFTAPVNGIYHFSFMTFGYGGHTSGAILVKNGSYQVSTWEFTGLDASDTTSNSVILEMNTGDCVNIILWHGGKIHTGVFSGFLIFPLV